MEFSDIRKQQIKCVEKVLSSQQCEEALFVGDCNICSTWKENQSFPSHFLDVWPALHPNEGTLYENSLRNNRVSWLDV